MIVFACVVLAFGLLAYIFVLPSETTSAPEKSRVSYLRERKEMVYENLRDLNFDFKAGKYPAEDYESLRNSLEAEAAEILAEMNVLEMATTSA